MSNAQWAEFFMGYEKNSVWLFPFVKKKNFAKINLMHFVSHLQSEEEIHPPSKIKRLKTTEEKNYFGIYILM